MNLREAIATQPMRPFQTRVIAICIFLAFVDGFEILIAGYVAPFLARPEVWGLTNVETGWLLSAGSIGLAAGGILISPLADRIGRRNHIFTCLVLIVIGMSLSAMSPNYPFLLVARAFAGLWIGALLPSVNILVSEYSSDARRGTAMGIYGIGLPAGAATGGFISTFLIDAWGWRAPFWFATAATVLLLVASWRWLPESIHFLLEKRPAHALEEYNRIADRLGYERAEELPPPRAGTVTRVGVSSLFHGLLAKRTSLLWIGFFCQYAAFYFANTWTPKLLSDATGDPTLGVRAGVLVSVGGIVGALVFALLATRIHPRLLTSGLAVFFGLACFGLYANFFGTPALALVLALAVGFTTNGGNAAYYAISPPVYPTRVRATGVGWMIGIGRIGSIIAPVVAGYLLAAGMTASGLYQIFGVVIAVGGVMVYLLHRTYRGQEEDADKLVAELTYETPTSPR
jgi:benzoate transport